MLKSWCVRTERCFFSQHLTFLSVFGSKRKAKFTVFQITFNYDRERTRFQLGFSWQRARQWYHAGMRSKAGITQMKSYGNTRGSKKINICTEIVYTFTKARELNYSKESTEYYSKVLNKCLHKDSRCLHIHTDENKHTSISLLGNSALRMSHCQGSKWLTFLPRTDCIQSCSRRKKRWQN